MADFGGHKSTKAGQNLQAKLFSTMRPLVYSCVKVGDGQLGAKVIADLTSLVHTRLTLEITATPTRNQDGRWNITGVLSNRELTEPLKFREWGVFARDPDTDIDVLVAYANAGESADIINPWDGSTISTLIEEEITCACLVTGDLQVDAIIIDPTQLYVPRAVFDEHNHDDRYYSKEEVSAQLGEMTLDCGTFDGDTPVNTHNASAAAHPNLIAYGGTLEEHMTDPLSHENIILDGNAG